MSDTLPEFFSHHWGAQGKGKHWDLHAAGRTAAHQLSSFPWQLLANHSSCREVLVVQKGCSKVPQSAQSLFQPVSKAARNRCPSAADAGITQTSSSNKGFPQKSFTSSFLGIYYHDRRKGESKKLSWQHGRPLPQAKQNKLPSVPKSCNL